MDESEIRQLKTEHASILMENAHLRLQCLALTEAHESLTVMVEKQREMIRLLEIRVLEERRASDDWRLWNPGADSTFTGEKKKNG